MLEQEWLDVGRGVEYTLLHTFAFTLKSQLLRPADWYGL